MMNMPHVGERAMSKDEIRFVIHRANGSHKGERIMGVEISQEIRKISSGRYVGVRTTMFDKPITVHNGETLSLQRIPNE